MTLAVMSRATLGHTGQRSDRIRQPRRCIYAAIIVAALARICAAIDPAHYGVVAACCRLCLGRAAFARFLNQLRPVAHQPKVTM